LAEYMLGVFLTTIPCICLLINTLIYSGFLIEGWHDEWWRLCHDIRIPSDCTPAEVKLLVLLTSRFKNHVRNENLSSLYAMQGMWICLNCQLSSKMARCYCVSEEFAKNPPILLLISRRTVPSRGRNSYGAHKYAQTDFDCEQINVCVEYCVSDLLCCPCLEL
jgi:hypothetical protein